MTENSRRELENAAREVMRTNFEIGDCIQNAARGIALLQYIYGESEAIGIILDSMRVEDREWAKQRAKELGLP